MVLGEGFNGCQQLACITSATGHLDPASHYLAHAHPCMEQDLLYFPVSLPFWEDEGW